MMPTCVEARDVEMPHKHPLRDPPHDSQRFTKVISMMEMKNNNDLIHYVIMQQLSELCNGAVRRFRLQGRLHPWRMRMGTAGSPVIDDLPFVSSVGGNDRLRQNIGIQPRAPSITVKRQASKRPVLAGPGSHAPSSYRSTQRDRAVLRLMTLSPNRTIFDFLDKVS
jgi:hypothetical protein